MRPMWKGFVTFGLVTIPVQLLNAVEGREEIHFHLLHRQDQGRIRNKRVCEVCGKDVAWGEIVKGYEHEKDSYVVMDESDFAKADVGASASIEILDFVDVDALDARSFDRPCYLEPQRGGDRPYALLREALRKTKKAGIAKIVLRTRQSLAWIAPLGDALLLEIIRFADEVRGTEGLSLPPAKLAHERPKELELASKLIEQMSSPLDLAKYEDDWKVKVEAILEEKTKGASPRSRGTAPSPTRVADLVSVLERSLSSRATAGHDGAGGNGGAAGGAHPHGSKRASMARRASARAKKRARRAA